MDTCTCSTYVYTYAHTHAHMFMSLYFSYMLFQKNWSWGHWTCKEKTNNTSNLPVAWGEGSIKSLH